MLKYFTQQGGQAVLISGLLLFTGCATRETPDIYSDYYVDTGKKVASDSIETSTPNAECAHSDTELNCVKFAYYGESKILYFDLPNIPRVLGENVAFVLRDLVTPSSGGAGDCENEVALKLKDHLSKKLKSAKRIDLRKLTRESGSGYFLTDVFVDQNSLSEDLVEQKLARWSSGTQIEQSWCNGDTSL